MADLTIVIKLLIAFLLGGMIGWLREKEGKNAGLRTHILVAVGSALFTMLSSEMLSISGSADPGRVAAGIVTGIGFIGAGCIVQSRGSIKGITTAASIWISSAIGVAVAIGYYVGAVTGTLITIFTLQVLREVESKIFKTKEF